MAKVGVNIDVEISRVAAERDKLLRAISPALPIVRLERLQVALVQAYPVDTALKSIADERDRSLELGNGIPRSVELLLSNRVRLVTGARRAAPTSEPLVWRRRY